MRDQAARGPERGAANESGQGWAEGARMQGHPWVVLSPSYLRTTSQTKISSTQKSVKRVSKQCRASVSQCPTRENP
eukprot:8734427-Pyramimonas_sp.AAC.1